MSGTAFLSSEASGVRWLWWCNSQLVSVQTTSREESHPSLISNVISHIQKRLVWRCLLCLLFQHRPESRTGHFVRFSFSLVSCHISNPICDSSLRPTDTMEQLYFVWFRSSAVAMRQYFTNSLSKWSFGFLSHQLQNMPDCTTLCLSEWGFWRSLLDGELQRMLTLSGPISSPKSSSLTALEIDHHCQSISEK